MFIKTFIFNSFRVNMYIVWDDSGECVIIDGACYSDKEKERLVNFIEEQKLKPVALINTHGHVDHIVGNAFICKHYSIDSYLHKDDFSGLNYAEEHGKMFGFELENPPAPKELGSEVAFGKSTLQVLHTPGHSKGSVSLYAKNADVVFTGDTLFRGSIGRSDLPGGNLNELMQSLNLVLLTLPDNTKVLPGHGPQTSIGDERWGNPFLQPFEI